MYIFRKIFPILASLTGKIQYLGYFPGGISFCQETIETNQLDVEWVDGSGRMRIRDLDEANTRFFARSSTA